MPDYMHVFYVISGSQFYTVGVGPTPPRDTSVVDLLESNLLESSRLSNNSGSGSSMDGSGLYDNVRMKTFCMH